MLRIVGPRAVTATLARRERAQRERAAELDAIETRSRAVLRQLDAEISTCHYCQHPDLYAPLPEGQVCGCRTTAHNGAAVVERRGGGYRMPTNYRADGYPTRAECRGQPLEIRDCGPLLSVR